MAIKISGTTVIGDTKEVINVSSAGINTDNSQGNLLFINGSTENITITSDGFVGIGTTFFNSSTPRAALDVYATYGISANLLGVGTSKALPGDRVTIGNNDALSSGQSILGFYNFNSSADNRRWLVGPQGEVFFLQALDDSNPGVGGGNRIAIGRSDNELRSFELRSGDVPFFYADFYEKNIGIASTQPSHLMDVGGTVSATNYVSSGCLTSTSNTNLSIDASLYAHVFHESTITSNRLYQIYNLTPGREIKIFIKNTAGANRTMTFEASETTSGFSNVRIADSAYNDINTVTLNASDIRLITIMNMNGNFVGGS